MRIKLIFLSFFILFCNLSLAEGQDGLGNILSFGYSLMIITNLLIYIFVIGVLVKFLFFKGNSKNGFTKSFLISTLISLLLLVIFKDEFTFLLFNIL
jgi:L-asparagine transporter-like permease